MEATSIQVHTKFSPELIVQDVEHHGMDGTVERVIRLRDQGVRDALKALGWISPEEAKDTQSQLAQVREEKRGLDRLLASVPDLVKDAFQEGFRVDGGGLGDAWDASHAKAALNGQANPRPPSWDADKERTQLLEIQIAHARAELERVRFEAKDAAVLAERCDISWQEAFNILRAALTPTTTNQKEAGNG